ncbi:transporter substrate-binding domain-containing protein [Orbus mooreae]|uniref:transporter substrate-binding domain-containing protein n=1 Tax=Orbus mooreae TaxID=3074107 RepID=UPI00370D1758
MAIRKYFFLIISIFTLYTTTCYAELDDILKRGALKVAIPTDYPPFGFVGKDLQAQGYDIDVAKYLAKQLNVKIVLVPVTSANRIPYLQTQKVDLVISTLGKTAERENIIDFTIPYGPFYLGIFGSPSLSVNNIDDLANKTVGVTRGGIEDIILSEIAPAQTIIKRYEDNNTTLSAYLADQVELISTGNVIIYAINNMDNSKPTVGKITLKNSPNHIGLRKNEPELKDKINELLQQAINDGTLNEYSQKWLGMPFTTDQQTMSLY